MHFVGLYCIITSEVLSDKPATWLGGCSYSMCILQVLHGCCTTSVEAKLRISCSHNNTGHITANHCDCCSQWEATCRWYVWGQPNCVCWAIHHTHCEARGEGYLRVACFSLSGRMYKARSPYFITFWKVATNLSENNKQWKVLRKKL